MSDVGRSLIGVGIGIGGERPSVDLAPCIAETQPGAGLRIHRRVVTDHRAVESGGIPEERIHRILAAEISEAFRPPAAAQVVLSTRRRHLLGPCRRVNRVADLPAHDRIHARQPQILKLPRSLECHERRRQIRRGGGKLRDCIDDRGRRGERIDCGNDGDNRRCWGDGRKHGYQRYHDRSGNRLGRGHDRRNNRRHRHHYDGGSGRGRGRNDRNRNRDRGRGWVGVITIGTSNGMRVACMVTRPAGVPVRGTWENA